jgi:hypothetical protein
VLFAFGGLLYLTNYILYSQLIHGALALMFLCVSIVFHGLYRTAKRDSGKG